MQSKTKVLAAPEVPYNPPQASTPTMHSPLVRYRKTIEMDGLSFPEEVTFKLSSKK